MVSVTGLNDLGVDAKTIRSILRYGNISTTPAFYILTGKTKGEAGLRKFCKALEKYGIKS
ncbi:MAG: hypothetical protein DMG30_13390 [Acidobacteria bacterium]|nr:MAG: hypothetical protein DMG30_13390 [Acidobacteriota bacterium]